MDADQIGVVEANACPNCGALDGKKLSSEALEALAHRFFVWGSLWRCRYGAAPVITFNQHQKTCIDFSPWLAPDIKLFERLLGVGFFHYGPRLWMVGEIEPLKALQKFRTRQAVIERVLSEYPTTSLRPGLIFYRIRIGPSAPAEPSQYDSPPSAFAGKNRLDSYNAPVLYGSSDLQICVHECRVTTEDEVYVATLTPKSSLRLLDLTALLKEENVTEFESLDMAVHMLFLAGKHAYKITREIAAAVRNAGFDGVVYPSYFSLLRLGAMPFQTVYGISHRRIPQYQKNEQAKAIPNLALFGRPIEAGTVAVQSINKLIISRVAYDFHFGPAAF
ncbi:RES family NAD+ phosphorylase [Nitrosospira sp. Nsp1]|uniref:RES family NAD+ phosphorylase n=1 Tax=Nitrosospira sp. Nsp1 TaxID=136547 RepID=UPI001C40B491|nr:RES family NAD+ phosphorylase [Nitrosospira sp. Nsp1]